VKIEIDQKKCIGCGFCRERLPSLFFLDGYAARLTEAGGNIDDSNEILIRQITAAAEICPAETIEIHTNKSEKTFTGNQGNTALQT